MFPNYLLSHDSNVPYMSALYYRVKRSAVECSAVACSAVECSAVECSTVECSTLQMKL